jgi:hypothetical protein
MVICICLLFSVQGKSISYAVFLFQQMFTHRNYKALDGPHISMRGQIQFLKKSWLSVSSNNLHRKNMIGIFPWLLNAKNEGAIISSGRATARPPRAAGRARRRRSKGNFLYIKVESCNFLAKYFCIIEIVRAPKSFWLRQW